MAKFKIGDRVRVNEKCPVFCKDIRAKEFMITEETRKGLYEAMDGKGGFLHNFSEEFLDLVSSPDKPSGKLNLVEILKDCPVGTKFYSTIYGEVELVTAKPDKAEDEYPIVFRIVFRTLKEDIECVTSDGRDNVHYPGECTFFPSKEMRDWSKWKCPKPDLAVDTPVMISDDGKNWFLRYYAGNKEAWKCGLKSASFKNKQKKAENVYYCDHIIPFDKFNPNDIEGSLKFDICRED